MLVTTVTLEGVPSPSSPSPAPVVAGPTEVRAPDSGAGRNRRLRTRTRVTVAVLLAAAVGVAAFQYRAALDGTGLAAALRTPHWGWLAAAGVAAVASYVGNCWNLMGVSPARLRLARTLAVQLTGTLTRLVSPSAVGAAAINLRYLRRAGVGNVAAVGAVSVAQLVQVVATAALLPFVLLATQRDVDLLGGLTHPVVAVGGAAVLVAVVVAAFVVARTRPLLAARGRFLFSELTESLRMMRRRPRRVALALAGSMVVLAGQSVAVWASVYAFGGEVGLGVATCALLLGTTAGNAVPVPGGIGAVDAALVATLGTLGGVPVAVALPAVALYRILTLWIQMPAGLVCAPFLRRAGVL